VEPRPGLRASDASIWDEVRRVVGEVVVRRRVPPFDVDDVVQGTLCNLIVRVRAGGVDDLIAYAVRCATVECHLYRRRRARAPTFVATSALDSCGAPCLHHRPASESHPALEDVIARVGGHLTLREMQLLHAVVRTNARTIRGLAAAHGCQPQDVRRLIKSIGRKVEFLREPVPAEHQSMCARGPTWSPPESAAPVGRAHPTRGAS